MRIYWGLYTDMALVSNVWENDKDNYELNFVTICVIYTGQTYLKTLHTVWNQL